MNTDYICENDGLERPYGATEEEREKFYEAHPYRVEITSYTREERIMNARHDTDFGSNIDIRFFDNFKDALIFAKTHSEEEEGDGEEEFECDVIKDNRVILTADRERVNGFKVGVMKLTDDVLSDVTDVFGCSAEDVRSTASVTWHLN